MRKTGFAAAIVSLLGIGNAIAETTECTVINSIPTSITTQGVYCLKSNLNSPLTSGQMIDIQTNNVTIDLNGYKLGGLAAGSGTTTSGIFAQGRTNIVIRNGFIRGFRYGVNIFGGESGVTIEDIQADGNTQFGLYVTGNGNTIRNNIVLQTGGSDLGNTAIGIYLGSSSGSIIENNVVKDASDVTSGIGINIESSNTTIVQDNKVFDLSGPNQYGIRMVNSDHITVLGNILTDVSGGTTGIIASSSSAIDCINNIGRGFAAGQTGCTVDSGNIFN